MDWKCTGQTAKSSHVGLGGWQLPQAGPLSDSTQALTVQLRRWGKGFVFPGEGFGIFRTVSEIPSEPPEPLQNQARAVHILGLPMCDCGFSLVCPQRASGENGVGRATGVGALLSGELT